MTPPSVWVNPQAEDVIYFRLEVLQAAGFIDNSGEPTLFETFGHWHSAAERNDGDAAGLFDALEKPDGFLAVHTGHVEVHYDEVRRRARRQPNAGERITGLEHVEPLRLQ